MRPLHTPVGLADSRIFYRATCWSGFVDVMGMNLHRGIVDTGFLARSKSIASQHQHHAVQG